MDLPRHHKDTMYQNICILRMFEVTYVKHFGKCVCCRLYPWIGQTGLITKPCDTKYLNHISNLFKLEYARTQCAQYTSSICASGHLDHAQPLAWDKVLPSYLIMTLLGPHAYDYVGPQVTCHTCLYRLL